MDQQNKKNMERDLINDQKLSSMGWTVLRFWGDEIKKNLDGCVKTIEETIIDSKVSNASDNVLIVTPKNDK